jgi:NAD(P)-dependent dehydrogenase (short-subunit alcohol dehydrogenase family)
MVVIAITGGASGCGYEAARQLSAVSEVTKIVITARSAQKVDGAISKLVKETGKDKSFYDSIILDLGNMSSIQSAIAAFPDFDRLCLNAGGFGTGKMHSSGNHMTDSMVINTMGHAVLVDGLLAAGKLPKGSRVVFVGSEVSRALWSFMPMLPNYCGRFKEKDINWAIGRDYDGICSCFPIRRQMGDYKNAKIIGHMHFAHLAKEHPELHVISVSPGAIGGSFAETGHFPVKQLMACVPGMFRCMMVTHACSPADSLQIGVKRYVDVLTGEPKWPTGSMPMSGKAPCGCCFWGAYGTMIDNRPEVPYFRDEAMCSKTATKVRDWNNKWKNLAPTQQTMQ